MQVKADKTEFLRNPFRIQFHYTTFAGRMHFSYFYISPYDVGLVDSTHAIFAWCFLCLAGDVSMHRAPELLRKVSIRQCLGFFAKSR